MSKLKLVIEHEVEEDEDNSMLEIVDYLNEVATLVKDGIMVGVDWQIHEDEE
jgi:hypothetical protein